MGVWHGVNDDIKGVCHLEHLIFIGGQHHTARPQAVSVIGFSKRTGKERNFRPHSMSKFDRHISQSAQSDHAYLGVFADFPMTQGRVGGNACTQ